MKRTSALVLSVAFIASMFAGCTKDTPAMKAFKENYGEQLVNYLDHQYYFDGQAVPTTESNFYFVNAFLDLSTYALYGYYPATTLGYLDLSAEYSGEEYATYGDYFVSYAEYSLESTLVLDARAKAAGTTLSAETYQDIDEMIEKMKSDAAESGKTLDEYIQSYYGEGYDEASFRQVLEGYFLADAYSKSYCENYEFTDEERYVPYIRYALFYAPDDVTQEDKDKALERATEMKDACSSIDDMTDLAVSAQELGTVYDQGDIAVPKGQMVQKFEEWAYGEGRTEGELDIIYAPEYGYFLVGYLGLTEQDQNSLDNIALSELSQSVSEEVNAKTHNFHTDDVYKAAPAAPTPTSVPSATGNGTMNTSDVVIVVFITLAAVAVVAVVFVLVVHALKNTQDGNGYQSRSSGRFYDDDDEDDYEQPVRSNKSNKSKPQNRGNNTGSSKKNNNNRSNSSNKRRKRKSR